MLSFKFVVNQSLRRLNQASGLRSQSRLYSLTRVHQSTESSKPQQPESVDPPVKISQPSEQVEVLYKMPQHFTIRTMLAITAVNTFVSTACCTNPPISFRMDVDGYCTYVAHEVTP